MSHLSNKKLPENLKFQQKKLQRIFHCQEFSLEKPLKKK
jgi:hypothetical protein